MVSADAPTALEYLPGAHFSQSDSWSLPRAAVNLPATHSMQVVAVVAADAFENLPCGHLSQAADPLACLYVPGRQLAHGRPCGPVNPALHCDKGPSGNTASERMNDNDNRWKSLGARQWCWHTEQSVRVVERHRWGGYIQYRAVGELVAVGRAVGVGWATVNGASLADAGAVA